MIPHRAQLEMGRNGSGAALPPLQQGMVAAAVPGRAGGRVEAMLLSTEWKGEGKFLLVLGT